MSATYDLELTGIADELKWIRQQYHSDVVNVIISIGILTEDTDSVMLQGYVVFRKDEEYKVWLKHSNKVIFHGEVIETGVRAETFERGKWEELLETKSRELLNGKEKNKRPTKPVRTRRSKSRIAG